MGRLIDADALEKEGWQLVRVNPKVPPVNEHKYLKDVPTAYDVDKVEKELKEWTFEADIIMPFNKEVVKNNKVIMSSNVIEIVRKGGVNE